MYGQLDIFCDTVIALEGDSEEQVEEWLLNKIVDYVQLCKTLRQEITGYSMIELEEDFFISASDIIDSSGNPNFKLHKEPPVFTIKTTGE